MQNVNLPVGTKVTVRTAAQELEYILAPLYANGMTGTVVSVDDEVSKGWPENHQVKLENGESWYFVPTMLQVNEETK